MVSKVVSTKLSIEEHGKFLEICRMQNCTPSTLVKNLILNLIANLEKNENLLSQKQSVKTLVNDQKKQLIFTSQNENQISQLTINETTASEIIKKIDNNEVSVEDLNHIYLKLGEKFEKNGLSKPEEILYRKTHQKLKERMQHKPIVQSEPQTKSIEEKKSDETKMSLEERFQYF